MSDFSTEWGVLSPWGANPSKSYSDAFSIVRNMREAGHDASIIWRGVTEWHHDISDELAMQPVELTKES